MDKNTLIRFILPIVLVFIVFFFKLSRDGLNVSTIYSVKKSQIHPMKNIYVMLLVFLLINFVALALLKANLFTSGTAITILIILLAILQCGVLFGYLFNKYKR
jgi:protein-S-isoprenylcysteine O-methyltransferase Ste14